MLFSATSIERWKGFWYPPTREAVPGTSGMVSGTKESCTQYQRVRLPVPRGSIQYQWGAVNRLCKPSSKKTSDNEVRETEPDK